ncbi:hypothetical protein D3C78_1677590 [compost metagenome]
MPIERRIVVSRTPMRRRTSIGTPEWVIAAGWLASDSVPPRLTASLKICSAFRKRKAASWPPDMSKEKVEPAPVHCAA